eukprot:TRINITY_DN5083_c0_g2_i1.p1 TRINITY_DN5083_c0_g2~~TRINITY_DN5083_c0_g2_i1.p1  ORF type:complete len:2114 (-),score=338.11 TRINITY_DN5083_c0_g2_i1:99-6440(-)
MSQHILDCRNVCTFALAVLLLQPLLTVTGFDTSDGYVANQTDTSDATANSTSSTTSLTTWTTTMTTTTETHTTQTVTTSTTILSSATAFSSTTTSPFTTSTFTKVTLTSKSTTTISRTDVTNTTTTTSATNSTTSAYTTTSSTSTYTKTISFTSKTRTSTTRTSTTSTSTTSTSSTNVLGLDTAELLLSTLTILFSVPVRLADWVEEPVRCSSMFSNTTMPLLGFVAKCLFLARDNSVQVELGVGARLSLGDHVSMLPGVVVPSGGHHAFGYGLNGTVTTPGPLVAVSVVLKGPAAVQACSLVRFSVTDSSGFAGRPPSVFWDIGNQTRHDLRDMLAPVFQEASRASLQVLEIKPDLLSEAFYRVREAILDELASEDNETDIADNMELNLEIEFKVSVVNWQGQRSNASAVLTLLGSGEPVPQMTATTSDVFEISENDSVEMGVELLPVDFARCSNSSDDSGLQASRLLPILQWEYLIHVPCANLSNSSNESSFSNTSNSSNFTECTGFEEFWQGIEGFAFLRDTNRKPGVLHLPGFTFQPNTSHRFRATAVFVSNSTARAIVEFNVTVLPRAAPVVVLEGPQETSEACDFTLKVTSVDDTTLQVPPPELSCGEPTIETSSAAKYEIESFFCRACCSEGSGSDSLFDGNPDTFWCSADGNVTTITFSFDTPCSISSYVVTSPKLGASARMFGRCYHWYHPPSAWVFEMQLQANGSWVILDSASGQFEADDVPCGASVTRSFPAASSTRFRLRLLEGLNWDIPTATVAYMLGDVSLSGIQETFGYAWSCHERDSMSPCCAIEPREGLDSTWLPWDHDYLGTGKKRYKERYSSRFWVEQLPGQFPNGTYLSHANNSAVPLPTCHVAFDGTLYIEGGHLPQGFYTFTAQAWRINESADYAGEGQITVMITDTSIPPVQLSVPWSANGRMSTTAGESTVDNALASVQGSESCPVLDTWEWQWTLTAESADSGSLVLSFLNTDRMQDSPSGTSGLTLTATGLDRGSLSPGVKYSFTLLRLTSQIEMDELNATLNSSGVVLLEEVTSRGNVAIKSQPFFADGPPLSGVLEMTPASGEALTSLFSFTTGWVDEDAAHLLYSFYRFPLDSLAASGIKADGGGGIIIGDMPENWTFPAIEWYNTSSPAYFVKLGGRLLRSWGKARTLAGISMAPGSYFVVARALDSLGAESAAMALGPIVLKPEEGFELSEAEVALELTSSSGEADRILDTVEAIGLVEWNDPVGKINGLMLNALKHAAQIVEASAEEIQKTSMTLSKALGRNVTNKSELLQACDVLEVCTDVSISDLAGVGADAGEAMLQSASLISSGNVHDTGNGSPDEGALYFVQANLVTHKVSGLISKIGDAIATKLEVGQSLKLGSVDDSGKGTKLHVVKANFASSRRHGIKEAGMLIPGSVLPRRSRRLASGSCDTVDARQTDWLLSNPYRWADPGKANLNGVVANHPDAAVKVLEIKRCGEVVSFTNQEPEAVLTVDLPEQPLLPDGYVLDPRCAMWSPSEQAWVFSGVEIKQPVYWDDLQVGCKASSGGGAYTAFHFPIAIEVTTTEEFWTTPLHTTFPYPPTLGWRGDICDVEDMPALPEGGAKEWNCSKQLGEGQSCTAVCEDTDHFKGIGCWKGATRLEWYVDTKCPPLQDLDSFVAMPSSQDSPIHVLGWVWGTSIAGGVFLCCVGAAIITWLWRAEKLPRSGRKRRTKQGNNKQELPSAFMDWAKQVAAVRTLKPGGESPPLQLEDKAWLPPSLPALADMQPQPRSTVMVPLPEGQAAQMFVEGNLDCGKKPGGFVLHLSKLTDDWAAQLRILFEDHKVTSEDPIHAVDGNGQRFEVLWTAKGLPDLPPEKLKPECFPMKFLIRPMAPAMSKHETFEKWFQEWTALQGSPRTRFTRPEPEVIEYKLNLDQLHKTEAQALKMSESLVGFPKQMYKLGIHVPGWPTDLEGFSRLEDGSYFLKASEAATSNPPEQPLPPESEPQNLPGLLSLEDERDLELGAVLDACGNAKLLRDKRSYLSIHGVEVDTSVTRGALAAAASKEIPDPALVRAEQEAAAALDREVASKELQMTAALFDNEGWEQKVSLLDGRTYWRNLVTGDKRSDPPPMYSKDKLPLYSFSK